MVVDTVVRQSVGQQVVGTTVNILCCYNVISLHVPGSGSYMQIAAAPEATAKAATPPSKAAILFSNTPSVGLVRRP